MERDFDIVGHNAEILPLTFPDAEIGTLEGEGAVKYAGVTLFLECEGGGDLPGVALDRQITRDLVCAIAQVFDLARFKPGQRVGGQCKPLVLFQFRIGFVVTGIDACQRDFNDDLGFFGPGRIEIELGGLELAERAVHFHVHLAVAERDAAGLRIKRGVFGGERSGRRTESESSGEYGGSQHSVEIHSGSPGRAMWLKGGWYSLPGKKRQHARQNIIFLYEVM